MAEAAMLTDACCSSAVERSVVSPRLASTHSENPGVRSIGAIHVQRDAELFIRMGERIDNALTSVALRRLRSKCPGRNDSRSLAHRTFVPPVNSVDTQSNPEHVRPPGCCDEAFGHDVVATAMGDRLVHYVDAIALEASATASNTPQSSLRPSSNRRQSDSNP